MNDQIKNIQRIQQESTTATTYIYPVGISGTNAAVLHIQAISIGYIDVSIAQPLSAGLGRSIQIDLKEAIKNKINMIKGIQKESTTATTYIYPVDVSGTSATVLPIHAVRNG